MFCYQCEQAAGGTGCTKVGVCGKDQDIQSLQDILLFGVKGIASYAYHARQLEEKDEQVVAFSITSLKSLFLMCLASETPAIPHVNIRSL